MQHIDREKAQRLIERMEALAKEENVNIQKIAECRSTHTRSGQSHDAGTGEVKLNLGGADIDAPIHRKIY